MAVSLNCHYDDDDDDDDDDDLPFAIEMMIMVKFNK